VLRQVPSGVARDEWLLQQLATLLASEEYRRKEQEKLKEKKSIHRSVKAKREADSESHQGKEEEQAMNVRRIIKGIE